MVTKKYDSERTKLIIHMFSELETPYKELTSWEEGFIADIHEQWKNKWGLSDRQFEILERIYAEKTS